MTITIRGQILAALRNNPGLNSARIASMIGMTTKNDIRNGEHAAGRRLDRVRRQARTAALSADRLRHEIRTRNNPGYAEGKFEAGAAYRGKRDLPGVPQQRGDEKNFKRIRGESMKNNTQPALKERIEKALEDFTKGRASMHVPPLDTDVDVVLAECSDRLSELKARCAALAAENAMLKQRTQQLIDIISNTDNDYCMCGSAMKDHVHSGCGYPTGMFDYYYNQWLESDNKTPATDAFLAEVRGA